MNEQDNSVQILAQALKQVMADSKDTDRKQDVHTAITLHDGGGIFSTCGLEREVITAHIRPEGIGSQLPLMPSVSTDPRFASITGFTQGYGAAAENACDDAPAGFMKGCELTNQFGLIRYDTNDIEFDVVMRKYNRGDFTDLQLWGTVIGEGMANGMWASGLNEGQILQIVTMAEMITAGVLANRALVTQMWQGNVALGQFPGLDAQIATGQMDASTGTLCPALDSDVKEFGYDDVCGTGRDIVEYMSMMAYYLEFNARKMGLAPVQWAVVMRPELWFELSACWPCSYLTNRCKDDAGTQVAVINDQTNTALKDRMRDNMVIPINGRDYTVVVDDGIFEHNSTNNANLAAGQFASSIYFVPLTILGGRPVTYREYLNYRDPVADANVRLLRDRNDFWTDNGVYSWAISNNKWCYTLHLKTEQRVVLRTPQLAGKIQNIMYSPLQHLRSGYPDSPYNFDGGLSIRPGGKKYSVYMSGAGSR